ncbi:MAG: DNA recombination protein RmuC [Bacteroidales bacterium]|nr:DNA recombination protein RmuC [Bacteroidales bacterium]
MMISGLIIGVFAGGIIAWVVAYLLNKTKTVAKKQFEELNLKYNEAVTTQKLAENQVLMLREERDHLSGRLTMRETELSQLQAKTVSIETQLSNNNDKCEGLAQQLSAEQTKSQSRQDEINLHKQTIAELQANNRSLNENASRLSQLAEKQTLQIEEFNAKNAELSAMNSSLKTSYQALNEKLHTQKTEMEELQKTAHLQFEKIANRLFEEKSEKFTEANKINIELLLNPLKDDINKFKEKVESTHTEDTKQRISLEERIKGLIEQTNKISAEANNLATALKGKSQKRGNWGEVILERILEASGLTKDREYFVQHSIKDDEGRTQRLDVKVNLPDERVIIIDSKVSLIAYDNYSASDDADEQRKFLTEHINATKLHIDQLSAKKYDDMNTSLDFTMMFIPIEPAYLLAIQGDPDLWSYAYSKRILLVSPTTLIACLKLFSDLWRREWQNKNAMDIVKRGELLYEKFVGFTQNFEEIGKKLDATQKAYGDALGQLKDGRGNLINQAEQLRKMGLKSDKRVPDRLLPPDIDDTDTETDEA